MKSRFPQLLDCEKVKSSLHKRWNFIQVCYGSAIDAAPLLPKPWAVAHGLWHGTVGDKDEMVVCESRCQGLGQREKVKRDQGQGQYFRTISSKSFPFWYAQVYGTCPLGDFQISLFLTDNLWCNTGKRGTFVPKQRAEQIMCTVGTCHTFLTQGCSRPVQRLQMSLVVDALGICVVRGRGCSFNSQ